MHRPVIKYIAAFFLLLLFVSKGVIEVLPAITNQYAAQHGQDLKLNPEQENNEEKAGEKQFEVREFITDANPGELSSLQYALLPGISLLDRPQRVTSVYLSIATPPPECHDL